MTRLAVARHSVVLEMWRREFSRLRAMLKLWGLGLQASDLETASSLVHETPNPETSAPLNQSTLASLGGVRGFGMRVGSGLGL